MRVEGWSNVHATTAFNLVTYLTNTQPKSRPGPSLSHEWARRLDDAQKILRLGALNDTLALLNLLTSRALHAHTELKPIFEGRRELAGCWGEGFGWTGFMET